MLHSRHDEPIKLWLSITRQEILGTEYLSTTFDPQEETIKGRFVCSSNLYIRSNNNIIYLV